LDKFLDSGDVNIKGSDRGNFSANMEANVDDSKFVYEVNDPNYFQLNKK
jgi:hypothetical protein